MSWFSSAALRLRGPNAAAAGDGAASGDGALPSQAGGSDSADAPAASAASPGVAGDAGPAASADGSAAASTVLGSWGASAYTAGESWGAYLRSSVSTSKASPGAAPTEANEGVAAEPTGDGAGAGSSSDSCAQMAPEATKPGERSSESWTLYHVGESLLTYARGRPTSSDAAEVEAAGPSAPAPSVEGAATALDGAAAVAPDGEEGAAGAEASASGETAEATASTSSRGLSSLLGASSEELRSAAQRTGETLAPSVTQAAGQLLSTAASTREQLRSTAAATGGHIYSKAASTGEHLVSTATATSEQLRSLPSSAMTTAAATGEQLMASAGVHLKAAYGLLGKRGAGGEGADGADATAEVPAVAADGDVGVGEAEGQGAGDVPPAEPETAASASAPQEEPASAPAVESSGVISVAGASAEDVGEEATGEEGDSAPVAEAEAEAVLETAAEMEAVFGTVGALQAAVIAGPLLRRKATIEELEQQPTKEADAALEMEAELSVQLKAKCWRCGELVLADMVSLEAHSQTCLRLEPNAGVGPEEEARLAADQAPQDVPPDEALQASVTEGGEAKPDIEGKSKGGITAYVRDSAYSTTAYVGDTIGTVKTKAFSYFSWSDGGVQTNEGIVGMQSVGNDKYLTVVDGSPETKVHAGLSSVTEESQWLVVKTPSTGVVTIKSLLTGWFLRVPESAPDDGAPRVLLAGGMRTERDEWRIVKGKSDHAAKVQSVYNNMFLCIVPDGRLGAVKASLVDGSVPKAAYWRVFGLGERLSSLSSATLSERLGELSPDLDPVQLYSRLESTMERLTVLMLDPVLHGIPKLGILPVREQAREHVARHSSAKAAIAAMLKEAADHEAQAGYSRFIVEQVSQLLIVRFLPFVGAGAYLSQMLFSRLRLAALVAEMYGHDTFDPEVQSMMLFCILPSATGDSEAAEAAPCEESPTSGGLSVKGPVMRAANGLAHGLARQVVKRATGFRTATDLYDLAAAILSKQRGSAEDAGSVESAEQATLRRADLLFRPSLARALKPAGLALLAAGAALPVVVSIIRKVSQLTRLLQHLLGVPLFVLLLLLVAFVAFAAFGAYVHLPIIASEQPQLVSSTIVGLHSALPLLAAFDAASLIVSGLSRGPLAADDGSGAGALCLLLGVWAWTRTTQRCRATPGSATARGEATPMQRTLLAVIVLLGSSDLLGADGIGLHSCPPFGALRSHHWLQGMVTATALECQLRLLMLLKDGEVILRVLGATRTMGLAISLFLGGLTASVGFLVSRSEFTKFVDSLAPTPRVSAAIIALRRDRAFFALAIGALAGVAWEMPHARLLAGVARLAGIVLGGGAIFVWLQTFEENRETLLEPSGGRWLLVLPETSQRAQLQALQVWAKLRVNAAEAAVEQGTTFVGRRVLNQVLDYGASLWAGRSAEAVAEAAVGMATGQSAAAAVAEAAT